MRIVFTLPLVSALALAACGSPDSADSDADGEITEAEAMAEASQMQAPAPGLYRSTVEVLEMEIPGIPSGMLEQAGSSITGSMSTTYCQTAEDSEKSIRDMTDGMGQGSCTYQAFDVSGGTINVAMTCTGEDGASGNYKMNGTVNSSGVDMSMVVDQSARGLPGGSMHMKGRVQSERVGDC